MVSKGLSLIQNSMHKLFETGRIYDFYALFADFSEGLFIPFGKNPFFSRKIHQKSI